MIYNFWSEIMLAQMALSGFLCAVLLSGCTTSPEVIKRHNDNVAVLHEKYENQLIDKGQSYAYISGVPHKCETYPLKSSLFCAFVVYSINGKSVEFTVPYDAFGSKVGYFPVSYSRLLLKIPAGTHDITVRGGKDRPYSKNLTIFKGVVFEAGKYYAITDKTDKNEDVVNFISEYVPDNKFTKSDKRYYRLTKTVSQYVYPNSDNVASE
jgi:hypothetical protein